MLLPGEWWRVLPRTFRDPYQPFSPNRAQSWSRILERGSARCIGEAVSTASLTTPTGHQELRRLVCRQILTEMSEQGGPPLRWRMTRQLCRNSRKGWRDRPSGRLCHMERLGAKASAETPPQSATDPFRWDSQGPRSGTETDQHLRELKTASNHRDGDELAPSGAGNRAGPSGCELKSLRGRK